MRSIGIALCIVTLAAAAAAETAARSRTDLAAEIVGLVKTEDSFDEMMQSIAGLQMQMIQQRGGSADAERIDAMMKKLGAVLKEEFSTTLKRDMVTAYAEVFTAEELQGLLDFYRSPVGKQFIEKTPELTRKSMQLQEKNFAKLWPKIEQALKEFALENPPVQ